MIVRPLQRQEIETIWTIDRSEVHHRVYRLRDGDLVLTPGYFDLQGWPPEQIEYDTPALYACFDWGGDFIGMFLDDQLVGVAVVDSIPLGIESDHLQLKYLYVSRAYRRQGVGTRLFHKARAIGRANWTGDPSPSNRSVLDCGCATPGAGCSAPSTGSHPAKREQPAHPGRRLVPRRLGSPAAPSSAGSGNGVCRRRRFQRAVRLEVANVVWSSGISLSQTNRTYAMQRPDRF